MKPSVAPVVLARTVRESANPLNLYRSFQRLKIFIPFHKRQVYSRYVKRKFVRNSYDEYIKRGNKTLNLLKDAFAGGSSNAQLVSNLLEIKYQRGLSKFNKKVPSGDVLLDEYVRRLNESEGLDI